MFPIFFPYVSHISHAFPIFFHMFSPLNFPPKFPAFAVIFGPSEVALAGKVPRVSWIYPSMDWFCWENLHRKPYGFSHQRQRGFPVSIFPSSPGSADEPSGPTTRIVTAGAEFWLVYACQSWETWEGFWSNSKESIKLSWLVLWNIFYFSIFWE